MSAASPKKAKAAKPKVPAEHPKYSEMVAAAIVALKERTGSSRQAITKYIGANYNVKDNAGTFIKATLKKGVAKGTLKQVKGTGASGSFRVVPKVEKKAPKKVKKPAAKKVKKTPKKAAAKKPAAKKAAVKAKKPAAKKPAAKKPAAKKPAAKKPAAKKAPAKKAPAKKAAKKTPKKTAKKPAKK
jgi:hypothetical protein